MSIFWAWFAGSTASISCSGTRKTSPAAPTSPTRRSRPSNGRSTATTSSGTTRSKSSTNGWSRSCTTQGVVPVAGTRLNTETPGQRDRPAIDCRPADLSHGRAGRPGRRQPGPPRQGPLAVGDPAIVNSTTWRNRSRNCSTIIFAGRKRLEIYRQFKMYNDPTLNPHIYGGKTSRSCNAHLSSRLLRSGRRAAGCCDNCRHGRDCPDRPASICRRARTCTDSRRA